MLLRILDKNKTAVAGITNFRELCITSSLDFSDKVLSFEAEISDIKDIVENEGYIETPDDRFVIKEIEEHSDGSASVIAQLDVEALEGMAWPKFVSGGVNTNGATIREAMQLALAGTGWTILESTVTKRRTMRLTNVSSLDVLKQALKTYRCEVIIDSKNQKLSFYTRIGENKGAYFKDNLNLTELTVKRSSYDYYTEIEPYGKDGVDISSINNNQKYLTNYTYSSKHKRLIWKDERYTVLENLKEDAQAKLDDMAKPYVSYAGNVIDLARESNRYSVFDFSLGDTVELIDSATFTKEQQRIVGLKVYPEEYWRNELTYANKILTFDEMVQKYDDAAATVDNITTDNGTVKGDTVDQIRTSQIVDLENAIVTNAYIQQLDADVINVSDTLNALNVHVGNITGNVGSFEQLAAKVFTANSAQIDSLISTEITATYGYIDNLITDYARINSLEAVEGRFNSLSADVANFKETATENLTALNGYIQNLDTVTLTAVNASINTLNTDYANIKSLLAGNAGIGDLQNIHLTSANAVIDQGLIDTLLANIAVIHDLIAGTISTSDIRIGSNDGGLAIRGNLIQFKDANGVVRIQIGKDTQGNFTFVLYDETGRGQLLNADGITASAIADGLIVNDMVADNAAISAEKLDIASLFRVINENGSETLKANRIYFDDEGQTLNQVYTQMSSSIETVEGQVGGIYSTADEARRASQTAITTAEAALLALQGITTIDALSAQLTNDAHVVHTNYNGTGGDFTFAKTQVKVYLGDTDITDHVNIELLPSAGVMGTWNPTTRIYQVTALDTLNGYVDFDVAFGNDFAPLQTPDGLNIQTPDDKRIIIKNGTVHINKRFSISKSPDGQAGVSYNLIASVDAIRRNMNGSLNPSSITFTANKAKGEETIAYSGIFMLELSTDGTNYTQVYKSSASELSKTYTPPNTAFSVRCTLYDENDVMLDMQSVIVIADADELADEIDAVKESVSTHESVITDISTGVDGMKVKLGNLQTQIYGLSDGELLVNVGTTYSGTSKVYTAYVYKGLEDIKTQFATSCFAWTLENADGEQFLGYGYSKTVALNQIDRDGCIRLDFVTVGTAHLQTPNGLNILTPNNKTITIDTEDKGQFARTATYDDIPGSANVTLAATSPRNLASPSSLNLSGLKGAKLNSTGITPTQAGLVNPDGSAVDILTLDDEYASDSDVTEVIEEEETYLTDEIESGNEDLTANTVQPVISLKSVAKLNASLNTISNDNSLESEEVEEGENTELQDNEDDPDITDETGEASSEAEDEVSEVTDEVDEETEEATLAEEIDTMIGELVTEMIEDMKALSAEYAAEFEVEETEEKAEIEAEETEGKEVTGDEGDCEDTLLQR